MLSFDGATLFPFITQRVEFPWRPRPFSVLFHLNGAFPHRSQHKNVQTQFAHSSCSPRVGHLGMRKSEGVTLKRGQIKTSFCRLGRCDTPCPTSHMHTTLQENKRYLTLSEVEATGGRISSQSRISPFKLHMGADTYLTRSLNFLTNNLVSESKIEE